MPTLSLPFSISQLPFPVTLEVALISLRGAALVAAFAVMAWAFSRWRRAQTQDTQRVFEQLDLIQGELHGLAEALASATARLDELGASMAAQSQLAPAQAAAAPRGYENAIRLAQRGVGAADIVADCGLARHEAELLVRLHGQTDGTPRTTTGASQADAGVRKRLAVVA